MIEIGVLGFFTLIRNIGDHKHGWIVVRHEENDHGSKFFVSSNVHRDCKEIDVVGFIPTPPKDAVFYNGKLYWLHMRIILEEDALYSYNMWSLDIGLKKWAIHAIHTRHIK